VSIAHRDDWLTIHQGDCRAVLAGLEAGSVHTVVTSPPYWGLRDYGHGDQLGLDPTPEEYVANMVAVFREVRRVLRGTTGRCGSTWGIATPRRRTRAVPTASKAARSGWGR
jgi:hypothetical protein